MEQHSEGPWHGGAKEDSIRGKSDAPVIFAKYGNRICKVDGSEEPMEANAALIKAAPLLLSALETLTDPEGHIWHGNNKECTGECKEVMTAIAKAREQSFW